MVRKRKPERLPDESGPLAMRRRSKAKPKARIPVGEASSPRFYYKGNRTKQLRAFCHVARLGHLGRAAEALFLSASTLSLQVSALERELGIALFDRTGRGLALTREGVMLHEMARPLIEGLDRLDTDFAAQRRGLGPVELNIAAGASTIQYLLPPLVRAFRERHPDVRLTLHNVTGQDGLGMLRGDAVDFAIGSMLDVPTDLSYEPVYRFDPVLITPLDHPLASKPTVTLADISPYGLILPPRRLTTYRMIDLVFQQAGVPYQVALEVGGWELIKQYVAMGLGISIVTAICLTPGDRVARHNLNRYFPQRSYGAVVRKGKFLGSEARAFLDLLKPSLFGAREYDQAGHSER